MALDVIDAFKYLLKAGQTVADATQAVTAKYTGEIKDRDDGPVFWIALADMQWTYGQLDPQVLKHVKQDFETGRGLERWRENKSGFPKRRATLEKFIAKISAPNPKPTKPPKLVVRAPKFQAGDCLSVRLPDGQYGAALVLVADHSNAEYGMNLVAMLDYHRADKPTIDVFHARKWFARTHHTWNGKHDIEWYLPVGFHAMKGRIEAIGRIDLLQSDPKTSNTYGGWADLGQHIVLQHEWDARKV